MSPAADLKSRLDALIRSSPVMLFMKVRPCGLILQNVAWCAMQTETSTSRRVTMASIATIGSCNDT